MDQPPFPDISQVERVRQVLTRGTEKMSEIGVEPADVMYGAMIVALGIARDLLGPDNVIDWLRNTADLQERAILQEARDFRERLQ